LFSKNKIFRDQGADFFQDPSNSLNEYFMKLGSHMSSEEENVFYIALVQIMMTNNLVVDIPRAEINNMQSMFHSCQPEEDTILPLQTIQYLDRLIDGSNES
jgi:hypothetical protein